MVFVRGDFNIIFILIRRKKNNLIFYFCVMKIYNISPFLKFKLIEISFDEVMNLYNIFSIDFTKKISLTLLDFIF